MYPKHAVLPYSLLKSWHVWAGLCQAGGSSMMAQLTGRRAGEYSTCLTLNQDIKAILCCCFSFSALSLTYKTKTYSHTHQPRTLPSPPLSLKVSFLLPVSLRSAMAEWVAVFLWVVWLSSCRSVSASVLDSLFLSSFLFPSLLWSWYQPGLFCVTLFFYFWVLFRDVPYRKHTPRERNTV